MVRLEVVGSPAKHDEEGFEFGPQAPSNQFGEAAASRQETTGCVGTWNLELLGLVWQRSHPAWLEEGRQTHGELEAFGKTHG